MCRRSTQGASTRLRLSHSQMWLCIQAISRDGGGLGKPPFLLWQSTLSISGKQFGMRAISKHRSHRGQSHPGCVVRGRHVTTLSLNISFCKMGVIMSLFQGVVVKRRDDIPGATFNSLTQWNSMTVTLITITAQVGGCILNRSGPSFKLAPGKN